MRTHQQGATEADNLAIKGVAEFYRDQGRHLVTLQTEHKAVLDSVKALEARGFTATYLPVQENGLVDVDELERALKWGREVRAADYGPTGIAVERALFVAQYGLDTEAAMQFEVGLAGG